MVIKRLSGSHRWSYEFTSMFIAKQPFESQAACSWAENLEQCAAKQKTRRVDNCKVRSCSGQKLSHPQFSSKSHVDDPSTKRKRLGTAFLIIPCIAAVSEIMLGGLLSVWSRSDPGTFIHIYLYISYIYIYIYIYVHTCCIYTYIYTYIYNYIYICIYI